MAENDPTESSSVMANRNRFAETNVRFDEEAECGGAANARFIAH